MYGSISKGKRLHSHQHVLVEVIHRSECFLKCIATQGCVSINVYNDPMSCPRGSSFCCEMNDDFASQIAQDFFNDVNSEYYELDHCA